MLGIPISRPHDRDLSAFIGSGVANMRALLKVTTSSKNVSATYFARARWIHWHQDGFTIVMHHLLQYGGLEYSCFSYFNVTKNSAFKAKRRFS